MTAPRCSEVRRNSALNFFRDSRESVVGWEQKLSSAGCGVDGYVGTGSRLVAANRPGPTPPIDRDSDSMPLSG